MQINVRFNQAKRTPAEGSDKHSGVDQGVKASPDLCFSLCEGPMLAVPRGEVAMVTRATAEGERNLVITVEQVLTEFEERIQRGNQLQTHIGSGVCINSLFFSC